MYIILVVTCFLSIIFSEASIKTICRDLTNKPKPIYYPLRHCQRSNKTVIAFNDFERFEECVDFARKSKGLAFNYSPKNRRTKNFYDITFANESRIHPKEKFKNDFHNCEVLGCPEKRNFSTVVNDTRFDYYSLYAYPIRKIN